MRLTTEVREAQSDKCVLNIKCVLFSGPIPNKKEKKKTT
jgi:hypothetical protein